MNIQQTTKSHILFFTYLFHPIVRTITGLSTKRSLNQRFKTYAEMEKYTVSPAKKRNFAVTDMGRIHEG
jgi:hypothetical protein